MFSMSVVISLSRQARSNFSRGKRIVMHKSNKLTTTSASFLLRGGLVLALAASAIGCSKTAAGGKAGEGADGFSESELNAQREGRFGEGTIPLAEGEGAFRDIYFDYDSSGI